LEPQVSKGILINCTFYNVLTAYDIAEPYAHMYNLVDDYWPTLQTMPEDTVDHSCGYFGPQNEIIATVGDAYWGGNSNSIATQHPSHSLVGNAGTSFAYDFFFQMWLPGPDVPDSAGFQHAASVQISDGKHIKVAYEDLFSV